MSGAKILAVANQKGGVGKTTTAVNVAAYLALGVRVLLVDLDPQANATSSLGLDPNGVELSTYDALIGQAPLGAVVVGSGRSQLDLAPASRALAGAQVELVDLPDRERRLKNALRELESVKQYDVVIVDTPPSLGILTLNALVAADLLLAPVQCEYLALEGVAQLMETIELVRATLNPRLELLGMLMTMYDPRTRLSPQVVDEVRRHFPDRTFQTVIPRSVRLSEAPSYGKPVLEYEPTSRGASAYADLAQELIERGLLRR
ncbi:MAG: ParA family protein [Chloroflexi bacterium]|nr:ParA family protein [Chloroflexota bacterium]MBV9899364.1 ParA family protein [Chloroflexota bacterium]